MLPISSKGCVSDINILASDINIDGKTNDLSSFGCEISTWKKFSGIIKNNIIKVFIDNKEVYQIKYNTKLGTIKGWHYFFKGTGAVKHLQLSDLKNNLIYDENFNEQL